VVDWYQEYVADTGRSAALFLILGFVITYAATRIITHRIRNRTATGAGESGPVKDVYIGGVHIHHQVWGILLVLLVGLLEFRFQPDSPWLELLAFLFGIGAALALDEFALWLYVKDVYWTEEGKRSIDAVLVAVVIGVALLMSTSPIGVDRDQLSEQGAVLASVFIVFHIVYTVICLLKGKLVTGLVGFLMPTIALVGAIRLAKPSSFWARRYYAGRNEKKLARSTERFGERYAARQERIRHLAGAARHPQNDGT
jgi:hypothetical protein